MLIISIDLKPARKGALMFAFLFLALSSAAPAQDAFGYIASSAIPYSYRNIAGTGTAVLANTDDGCATLALPFTFRFYGVSYNSLCVSTNGLVAFGSCVVNDFANIDLTAQKPSADQPLIAPYWTDLSFAVPGAGAVVYQTLGDPGSRQFILQWNNAIALNALGALNFQVILSEGSNAILFQYRNVQGGTASVSRGASATVGIRDAGGQANNRRLQWSYRVPVLSDELAIAFTPPSGALGAIDALIKYVNSLGLDSGIATSLVAKLNAAMVSVNQDKPAVCGQLGAFINEVRAQPVDRLTSAQAQQMIAAAQQILSVLGCN